MRRIERRAVVCLLLAGALALGLLLFVLRFFTQGGRWGSAPFNSHLYAGGQLAVGRVLDRDGDVLSWVDESGTRRYYESRTVRRATLHAVGDKGGNIGTGALVAFAGRLSGYNPLTGVYTPMGTGNDLYLTLDARYNYAAYSALNGRKGAVGVYNYKTGEILCMVSSPDFDPVDPPQNVEEDPRYDGVYLNRFLSGTFVPGSVFKTVTLSAALEALPDLHERRWTCTGSTLVGGEAVTCPEVHGEVDIGGALSKSCNGVFALLAAELGADRLTSSAQMAGLTKSYLVNGIQTAAGRFDVTQASENQLGWAGVGQYTDAVNPCALMVYMGAIANGGRAAVPQLILKTQPPLGPSLSFYLPRRTGQLLSPATVATLGDMMADNVANSYGTRRFPNMDLCAKSGTAEVGGGKAPNAWFAGFLRGEDTPYAFVVLVENGGSGASVAGDVAGRVLDVVVNGY